MSQEVSLQEAFDRATTALTQKQPTVAIDILEKIRATKRSSVDLEANLALAHARNKDPAQAVWHYTQAVAMNRTDGTLRKDLGLAQTQVPGGMGLGISHPAEWAWKLSSYVRPSEILAAASFLLLAYLGLLYVRRSLSRAQKISALGGVLLVAALGVFAGSSSSLAVSRVETSLRMGPLEASEERMRLIPGTRVRIIRQSPPFVEIERPNDSLRGWVKADDLNSLAF